MVEVVDQLWAKGEREFQYVAIDLLKARFHETGWIPSKQARSNNKSKAKKSSTEEPSTSTSTSKTTQDPIATIEIMKRWIVSKAWWDSVDALASGPLGKLVEAHRTELRPIMTAWAQDENSLWLRRAALLHQLSYKHQTDEAQLYEYIRYNLDHRDFFICKAIGYLLNSFLSFQIFNFRIPNIRILMFFFFVF
jgi:3-methyladenine DNA glycosylase AlkD